jgi:soluble lytic murein transglycosylase-like protein
MFRILVLVTLLFFGSSNQPSLACGTDLQALSSHIKQTNKKAPAEAIAQAILVGSSLYRVDPFLLAALIQQESDYKVEAIGAAGEKGLTQITRRTAGRLQLNWDSAFDILQNVGAGALYLSMHIEEYKDIDRALSRYNGGSKKYAAEVKQKYMNIIWNTLEYQARNPCVSR